MLPAGVRFRLRRFLEFITVIAAIVSAVAAMLAWQAADRSADDSAAALAVARHANDLSSQANGLASQANALASQANGLADAGLSARIDVSLVDTDQRYDDAYVPFCNDAQRELLRWQ